MNPKEDSRLYQEREIDESLPRTPDGEIDVYAPIALPKGPIYCERLDHPEKVAAEEKMLKEQALAKRLAQKQKKNYTVDPSVATYIIVKIRLRNGRTYVVAEVGVKDNSNVQSEAEELFDHFYHKLGKRFIHVKKPTHHAIRCSVVDELFVSYR